jgi:hypothetical protein
LTDLARALVRGPQLAAVFDAEESMLRTTSRRRSEAVAVKMSPFSTRDAPRQEARDEAVRAPAAVREPDEPRMNRIARRAHEIYEARGGEHGKAMEDWLQAEREVDAAMDAARTEG